MKRAMIVAAAVLVLPTCLWAAEGDGSNVYRWVGAKEGTAWGHHCAILVLAPVAGGNNVEMIVPNQDPMGVKLDPSPVIMAVAKDLKPGDVVKAGSAPFQGRTMLRSLTVYPVKPGETEPNVYVFEKTDTQKVGNQDGTVIVVGKLGQSATIALPMVKKDGKLVSDEDLSAAVGKLKKGDSIEVKVDKAGAAVVLRAVHLYTPPQKGEIVKAGEDKVGEKSVPCLEVKKDEQSVQLLVSCKKNEKGDLIPDADLAAKVKAAKAGQFVEYRCYDEDGKTWLVDFKPTAKPVPEKPKTN